MIIPHLLLASLYLPKFMTTKSIKEFNSATIPFNFGLISELNSLISFRCKYGSMSDFASLQSLSRSNTPSQLIFQCVFLIFIYSSYFCVRIVMSFLFSACSGKDLQDSPLALNLCNLLLSAEPSLADVPDFDWSDYRVFLAIDCGTMIICGLALVCRSEIRIENSLFTRNYLVALVVRPQERGKGIGRKLIALAAGNKELFLQCFEHKVSFYQHLGFRLRADCQVLSSTMSDQPLSTMSTDFDRQDQAYGELGYCFNNLVDVATTVPALTCKPDDDVVRQLKDAIKRQTNRTRKKKLSFILSAYHANHPRIDAMMEAIRTRRGISVDSFRINDYQ